MSTPDQTSPGDTPDQPFLHVDADWKAQAQAEKERLVKQESERESSPRRRGPDDLPPADFRGLVGILASQALMGLGGYGDPQSGRVVVDLAGAQFAIDLLDVLDKKTDGNLDAEESKELKLVLSELRSRYVHFSSMVAQQRGGAEPTATAATKPIIEAP